MKKTALMLAALLMLGSISVSAEETAAASELSDKWSDYQIQLNEDVYQIPMMYEDFIAYGWECDVTDLELEPNAYTWVSAEKDGVECTIYILNLGLNTEAAENCIVGGIRIDSYYWESGEGSVILPGGIEKGKADRAAIEAAYGTPSDVYEGDLYDELTYETDIWCELELAVYHESGVLEDISIQNFVEPAGFDAGEASGEVPAAVLAYTKPESLSDSLEDYQIEIDGCVYALPVPASVLIADGWELDETDSDEVIKAGSFGWATLRKGGQYFSTIVVNPESYATVPENCWVESLEISVNDPQEEAQLPGGIQMGMTEEEFLAVLDGAGMAYELDDSGDYKHYDYNKKEYGQCMEVTVYAGDDDYYEKNTIIDISCSNTVE